MAKSIPDISGDPFYDLSLPVYPGETRVHRTDIMLVQFLVKQFFSWKGATNSEKKRFADIHARATARGGRFDDGKYGPLTRQATYLYETSTTMPYKDGIFRVVGADIATTRIMKIKHLNWIFSLQVDEKDKRTFAKREMNPLLFESLYPMA